MCGQCADVIREDFNQVIVRVDANQKVLDKCFICGHKGFDYDVRDKVETIKSKNQV